MRNRYQAEREIAVAWDGLPIPEMIGGAIVGAFFLLTIVAVPPTGLRGSADGLSVVVGAILGAAISYVMRPRRILVKTTRRETPEDQHLRRAA
ncbi:MAG TPA: hypothetical protein VGA16_09070 [Candidatus Limnocylindria bacterium]